MHNEPNIQKDIKIEMKKQLNKRLCLTKNEKVVYKAGAVFERSGKYYQVQPDGSWRRMKDMEDK